MNTVRNIFDLTKVQSFEQEVFEEILKGGRFKVERIVSKGHVTPEGYWYDQDQDEWVMLVQGEAVLEIETEGVGAVTLNPGDFILLPAHRRHRVIFTSWEPECIWIALHFDPEER